MIKVLLNLLIILAGVFMFPIPGHTCSTFMLKTGKGVFVGHNLDESIRYNVQGMIYINKKGVHKVGRSWSDIYYYEAGEKPSPPISWVSNHASVTFSTRGRDFPDGGMNDAGLTISEMSLKKSIFKQDKSLPSLLIELWVQYQLDNFSTVTEVIENLPKIMVDGRTWHFLITDRKGGCGVIEFLQGKAVFYSGSDMPIQVLCNSDYKYECQRIKKYSGFGGNIPIDMNDPKIPRFVHAAKMVQDFPSGNQESEVPYCLKILEKLHKNRSKRWDNKWSYVFDVENLSVYFTTKGNREVRFFSLKDFDKSSDTPVKMLDVSCIHTGDVTKYFSDYTFEKNLDFIRRSHTETDRAYKNNSQWMKKAGVTPRQFWLKFAEYPRETRNR